MEWTPDGWVWVENSHNSNNGPEVVTNSVLHNSTENQGPDQWTGFFKELVGTGFAYALKKDAVTSGVVPKASSYTSTGQPVYMPTQAAPVNMNLLLVGALVVGAMFALKKE